MFKHQLQQRRTFFLLFKNWTNKKSVYPPAPSLFTTKNRIYENYIETNSELSNLILVKQPLILNFTVQADPTYNELTSSLFNVLSDKSKYPLGDYEVHLANITCDAPESKDLMLKYGVGKLPTLVRLEHQLVIDSLSPTDFSEQRVINWLKTFK